MTAIRGLKQGIGRLKNSRDNLHEGTKIVAHPSEEIRLHYNREYLERAKKAYAEAGGTYTFSKSEEKAAAFEESYKDMELTRYGDILKDNGLEWDLEAMENADVSNLNAQYVLELIMAAVRAERFSDGALLSLFKSGCILKWLERLNSIE